MDIRAAITLVEDASAPVSALDRWFAGSKLTTPDGRPLKLYHGTSKDGDFKSFKLPKNGIWFTTDPEDASEYAERNDSQGHRYDSVTRNYKPVHTAGRVIPVYVRATNVVHWDAWPEEMRTASNYKRVQGMIFDRLRMQGVEAIVMGGKIVVVISPTAQIKSAIGNRGAYDPAKKNLDEEDLEEGRARQVPPLPDAWNPKQIDPALLTYQEYYKICNSRGKSHPDSAYDTDLKSMSDKSYYAKGAYPRLLKRVKINGLYFEFRINSERRNLCKLDPKGEYLRDENGALIEMTDAEIDAAGLQKFKYNLCVYDDQNRPCGAVQDEWGCTLVTVAREYQGFGLGQMLLRLHYQFEPGKESGGMSPSGSRTFLKVYRETVRDALTSGRYRDLIRQGKLTPERVKAIVASADLKDRPSKKNLDLSSDNPRDWLLYAADGCFVVYDRKLPEVIERGGDDVWDWAERMVKGYLLVRIPDKAGLVVRFGAETPQLKAFLLNLGASFCAVEGTKLAIDEEDLPFVDKRFLSLGPVNKRTGMSRAIATPVGEPIDPTGMAREEEAFRAKFDRYGEFHSWILDLADRRYRPEDKDDEKEDRWAA